MIPEINFRSAVGSTYHTDFLCHFSYFGKFGTLCNLARILPVSVVNDANTDRSDKVIRATSDSGFDLVFECVIRFTAS